MVLKLSVIFMNTFVVVVVVVENTVVETRKVIEPSVLDFTILIQLFLESVFSESVKSSLTRSCVLGFWLSRVQIHCRVWISSMFLVATNVAVEGPTENKCSKLPWRSYYRQMNKSFFVTIMILSICFCPVFEKTKLKCRCGNNILKATL